MGFLISATRYVLLTHTGVPGAGVGQKCVGVQHNQQKAYTPLVRSRSRNHKKRDLPLTRPTSNEKTATHESGATPIRWFSFSCFALSLIWFPLHCFALLYCALHCSAWLFCALLCFAVFCCALLCFALLFMLLRFALCRK